MIAYPERLLLDHLVRPVPLPQEPAVGVGGLFRRVCLFAWSCSCGLHGSDGSWVSPHDAVAAGWAHTLEVVA